MFSLRQSFSIGGPAAQAFEESSAVRLAAEKIEFVEVIKYPAYNKSTKTATDLGWSLPGEGNPRPDCGKFRFRGCLRRAAHAGGKVYIEKYHASCNGRDCPVCVGGWSAYMARRIARRLERFRPSSLRGPSHVVFSPPAVLWQRDVKDLRRIVYAVAKSAGIKGGVVFFHPMRRKSQVDREYSPHFHVLGYGFLQRSSMVYARTGWVYKNLGVRRSVAGTVSYLASHAGTRPGFSVASWFGELSYNKFRSGGKVVVDVGRCPGCSGAIYEVVWNMGEPPMFGEFRGMTWPYGWDYLHQSLKQVTRRGSYFDGTLLQVHGSD